MTCWNIKELPLPPASSSTLTTKSIDIRLLEICLKDGIHFFGNQQHLTTEAALLSRAVYRFKMKFRSSKDFMVIEKLSRVLRCYLQMHLTDTLQSLLNCLPENYKTNTSYTLTKNMVDFVLVRLQGVGKILCRIIETCKISSNLMQLRLRLGHFWKIAVLILAASSRIYVISKSILKYVCETYVSILPFSLSLANSGVQWLSEDYCLPDRLDEWLNIDWLDLNNTVIEIPDDDPGFSYFKLTDSDDDIEFCDEYILIKDDSSTFAPDTNNEIDAVINLDDNSNYSDLSDKDEDVGVDVGEVLSVNGKKLDKKSKRKKATVQKNMPNTSVRKSTGKVKNNRKKKLNTSTSDEHMVGRKSGNKRKKQNKISPRKKNSL